MRHLETIAGFGIAGACLLVVFQVLTPYIPNVTLPWIAEVEQFMVIFAVFLAAGSVFLKGGHIGVEFVVDRLSHKWKRRFELFSTLIGGVFTLFVGVYAVEWVANEKILGTIMTSGLELPLWIPQMAVPVGYLLLAASMLWHLAKLARGRTEER